MTTRLKSRSGRYRPTRDRADDCEAAGRRLGLVNVVYRVLEGAPFYAGDDAVTGEHRLFCARNGVEIVESQEPRQGRLL